MTIPPQAAFPNMPAPLYRGSPSRLTRWLACPRAYRMTYLDRPRPTTRPQAAHISVGTAVHNVLRDFWDLPRERRTPVGVRALLRAHWVDAGFKDAAHSRRWRLRIGEEVVGYLRGIDRTASPISVERSIALRTDTMALTGRIDRVDERGGELVVVDYKTARRGLHVDDARTSLALAVYAEATSRTLRRPCTLVELHHVPTAQVIAHRHTAQSIGRKLAEADSIAAEASRAEADFACRGSESKLFAPRPSGLCRWCDFQEHCPQGRAIGPARPSWAGLDPDA